MISAWILRLLRALPELHVRPEKDSVAGESTLAVSVDSGPEIRFAVHERRLLSEESARLIVAESRGSSLPWLVAVNRLAPGTRRLLGSQGISSVERETRRCHLRGPGLLIDVTVRHDSDSPEEDTPNKRVGGYAPPPALLRDKSGLVAEALLRRDQKDPITLQELAQTTGLSRGLVSRLLSRLTNLGILTAFGSAPRKHWVLSDSGALLDRWRDEERPEPEEITGISLWSRTTDSLFAHLATVFQSPWNYAVAGAAAANLYAPTLTVPPVVDIWISAEHAASSVANVLAGEIVSTGANLRVLQTTGDPSLMLAQTLPASTPGFPGLRVVSPYRAYVEASRSTGRGPETANALRQVLRLQAHATEVAKDD